ncbi:carboxymuconolactone decarboxylase family protein [Paenibacillus sp. GCM10027626]|uniref:carboxymuconolactone decarboxylase family protein n=1 Tax=Paenibacillus sp. GCM10027626 TaxID=3273411 RepID=UPI00362FC1D7
MRMNYRTASPATFQALMKAEQYASETGIDRGLRELIKIRVSQINGCAFCLNMHTKDARKYGETEQRIYLLSCWHETSLFTEAEKAALALAEAVTRISESGVSDDIYERVRQFFSEEQFIQLIFIINTINNWNRVAISTGMEPGDFE